MQAQSQHHVGGSSVQGWDKALREAGCALNQCLIYDAVSPTARYRNPGVELAVAPLTITPSPQPAKFLLPLSSGVCCAGLQVLVPKGGMLLPKESIELEVKTVAWLLWILYASESTGKEGNLLVFPGPVIKVNEKLQQPNPGRITSGPGSGMMVWVTLPCKEPQPADAPTEGQGKTEWVVEEGTYKYQPWLVT